MSDGRWCSFMYSCTCIFPYTDSQSSTTINNGHMSRTTGPVHMSSTTGPVHMSRTTGPIRSRKRASAATEAVGPNRCSTSASWSSVVDRKPERGKLVAARRSLASKMKVDSEGGGEVPTHENGSIECERVPNVKEKGVGSLLESTDLTVIVKCSSLMSDQNSSNYDNHSNLSSTTNSTPVPIQSTDPVHTPDTSPHSKPSRKALKASTPLKASSPSKGRRKKRLHLKDLLGQAVVRALKKNRLSRSHPSFKACYTRLFNLSKMFVKVYTANHTSCHVINWLRQHPYGSQ